MEGEVVTTIRDAPNMFHAVLSDGLLIQPQLLRRRPRPRVWSPIEYVAHTQDALGWYEGRVRRVLEEPGTHLSAGLDWDLLAEQRRYIDWEVAGALSDMGSVAASLVGLLEDLTPAEWSLMGTGTDDGPRSVLHLAQRAAHEACHHCFDVARIVSG